MRARVNMCVRVCVHVLDVCRVKFVYVCMHFRWWWCEINVFALQAVKLTLPMCVCVAGCGLVELGCSDVWVADGRLPLHSGWRRELSFRHCQVNIHTCDTCTNTDSHIHMHTFMFLTTSSTHTHEHPMHVHRHTHALVLALTHWSHPPHIHTCPKHLNSISTQKHTHIHALSLFPCLSRADESSRRSLLSPKTWVP